MPTQEAKAHRVGEWASLRNTSPEEGSDEVLALAFAKTDKDILFWGEQTIERKNV